MLRYEVLPLVDLLDELVGDLCLFEEFAKDVVVNVRALRPLEKLDQLLQRCGRLRETNAILFIRFVILLDADDVFPAARLEEPSRCLERVLSSWA